MCEASDNEVEHPESDDEGESETYVSEPFPERELEPHGWTDILATLDVCTNKVIPTMFCDEEGYDLFPFQMVKVLQPTEEGAKVDDLEEELSARVVQNEISSFDHSSAHKPEDEDTTTRWKNSRRKTLMGNKGKLATYGLKNQRWEGDPIA